MQLQDIYSLSRETLQSLKNNEIQSTLEKELKEAQDKVQQIQTVEEALEIEKELVKVINDYDHSLDERKYQLPEKCEWDGKSYKKSEVAKKVLYFLNKNTVEWQYTLGLYQTYKLWLGDPSEIHYRHYDSTLRLLNQVKFTGNQEWTDILIVNEFMSSCHHDYTADTAWYLFLSNVHSAIISRAEALKPVGELKKEE